jgi:hypothetical protein
MQRKVGWQTKAQEAIGFFVVQRSGGLTAPDQPHFDDASSPVFRDLLTRSKFYLEFGSGGSTVLAARLGIKTLSVESDRFFAKAVLAKLPVGAPTEILTPNIGLTKQWGVPVLKRRSERRLARWARYIDAPFERLREAGAAFPDLVLVDGRFRVACALESARQATLRSRNLTIFFDDYAGRPFYEGVEAYLGAPDIVGRVALFNVGERSQGIPEFAVAAAKRDFR